MNNSILLVLVCFGLSWLGCEKEALTELETPTLALTVDNDSQLLPTIDGVRQMATGSCGSMERPFSFDAHTSETSASGYVAQINWGSFRVSDTDLPTQVDVYTNGDHFDHFEFTNSCSFIDDVAPLMIDESHFAACPREIKVTVTLPAVSATGNPISSGHYEYIFQAPREDGSLCANVQYEAG